jgi:GDP-L-fucose synthase
VDDLADALVFMMKHYSAEQHVNVGTGTDVTIRELAELIAEVAQYEGAFVYDPSKPDGTPRKVMDIGRLTALGWKAATSLELGLRHTYEAYANGLRSEQEA